ncbi:Short-chain dehydrogenase/reductase SDR [Alloalcanivorax dieselolei B5]|uniref:Short-chain dehydrogenase/reductase SDR n=1 Tax=Alcanivorax dieselolei (strain DSM 16502 / CGMCC 1.3690 / MCCC 1A00001 / B-5) TaxID=930169 RepID=K0CEJ1_ALCDB|nr:SDR family NAD(P)-dependent oxidoreductase [Alloalcanivorax dieselolei]AFT71058.1 Short-chain dehydrogenase/reductase SDR [Alloalcanivorax dieselolei B5]GGK00437.1 oxidoreductase [Alloalcanivorax dieselolei]
MKSVVVTGVSSGIGRGTLNVLIERGWHVFGSVRKIEDIRSLKDQYGDSFTPLLMDIQDESAVLSAAELVREALGDRNLDGLVNNAGGSFSDPLLLQSVADFRKQIDINLVGMFAVIRAFAPLLGASSSHSDAKGRIVNLSSVGGTFGPPFLGAYSAAKHGVEGLSESLRRELMLVGIDVIVIGPGSVRTAIWDKADAASTDHLTGTIWEHPFLKFKAAMADGGRKGLPPEAIGQAVEVALTARKPRVRYAVLPRREYLTNLLPRFLPARWVDRALARQFGLLSSS